MSTWEIIEGDCLEVMAGMEDESIDMILADPPYGTTACKWDSIIPLAPMWQQLKRLIKPNGAIVMTASQPFTTTLIASNMKMFKYCWVWNKKFAGNFVLANYQPMKIHEDIVIFSVKAHNYYPQKTTRQTPIKKGKHASNSGSSNLVYAHPEYDNTIYTDKHPESILCYSSRKEKRGFHPTQKPVALMEYLILTYTNKGEMVLDFTMGSGTTGVAALQTGRRFIGIEKDAGYCEIARNRISQAMPLFAWGVGSR